MDNHEDFTKLALDFSNDPLTVAASPQAPVRDNGMNKDRKNPHHLSSLVYEITRGHLQWMHMLNRATLETHDTKQSFLFRCSNIR